MSFNNTSTDILLAGAFAALSVDLLVYPLDTIKTRVQSPNYKKLYTNPATNTASRALFRGLYQGIGSVVLATIPSSGAFFTTYEGTKSILHNLNPTTASGASFIPTPVIHSLASCTGELVSCLILTPAEVLKQNAQVVIRPANSKTTAFDGNATRLALQKIRKPSQLWRGYTVLVARNLPFTAMQFPMFEHLKTAILAYRKRHNLASDTLLERGVVTCVAAGCAGSVSAFVTTPIDVVKTRIMLSAGSEGGRSSGAETRPHPSSASPKVEPNSSTRLAAREGRAGSLAVGREILKSEGVKGLFRGAILRSCWTALGSGLYLSMYETCRRYLEKRRVGKDAD